MRSKIHIVTALLVLIVTRAFGQNPIDVAESTFKITAHGEEVFYYGFAEGDQLLFSFDVIKGGRLTELEISEQPSSTKFMAYKMKTVENRTISIPKTGIYKFRFTNATICGRVCTLKIQRIPAGEKTRYFNTSVAWKTVYDTTYVIEKDKEKYLIKDTLVSNITDMVTKVHSMGNLNGHKNTFNFRLPDNTVAWSYYIGVDQAGQQAYANAVKELSKKAGSVISFIPGYGPLAALALGGASYLSQLQSGEDIDYCIVDDANEKLLSAGQKSVYIKKGKVINDYSKMTTPLKGMFHICLNNDNAIESVDVAVKITAIVVNQHWGTRQVRTLHITPRQEACLKK